MEKEKNKKTPKKKYGKSRRIRNFAENVIMICLVGIMITCGFNIYKIMHNYNTNQKKYDKVTELAGTMDFTGNVDFDELRKINPDIIGWIYYEDTKINYPIVQGKDNDKYLRTMFDGNYSNFGTLFADYKTKDPFNQFNTIVYGHHMRNGSMFGQLKKLKDESYYEKHKQFELITPEGKYHLQIVAFLNEPSDSDVYVNNVDGDSEKENYIEKIKSLSLYTTGVDFTADDRLVVLSTCAYEYDDARYIAVGKMVKWSDEELAAAKRLDAKRGGATEKVKVENYDD